MVADIFETCSRKEVVIRFLSLYKEGAKRSFSSDSSYYYSGVGFLQESIKGNQIDIQKIREANDSFALAVQDSKSTCKLLSYLGNVVCLYVLDQIMAISPILAIVKTLHLILDVPIPTKISAKGCLENSVKGLGVILGLALSMVPPVRIYGIALAKSS